MGPEEETDSKPKADSSKNEDAKTSGAASVL